MVKETRANQSITNKTRNYKNHHTYLKKLM